MSTFDEHFRDWIAGTYRDASTRVTADESRFEPEPGRYHLYIGRSGPWSHGTALVRQLTDLTDAVTMDVVDYIREDEGWEFSPEKAGCTEDSVHGFDYLREVYTTADPEYTGPVSVPVLWDRERETIVNNESIEIMRMFATTFADGAERDVNLYPEGYREEIDWIIEVIYNSINKGVYRAGFAESQNAYESAVEDVFDALDHWNSVLAEQRYLAGDRLTLADIRMFPTLVRFDQVYHTGFKCDRQFLHQYEYLWPYLLDLYQTPGVAATVNIEHIKRGYYQGELVAVGPDVDYDAPHDRDRLPGGPPEALVPA
jgi:putative glutathione S-transferase